MRKLRQSQVINNFFTLASIIMICVVLTLYTKYIAPDDNPKLQEKIIPLKCEKEDLLIKKVFNQSLLNDSIKLLNKGFYTIKGNLKENKIAQEFISIEELNSYFIQAIDIKQREKIAKSLSIEYKILNKDNKNLKEIKRKSFYSGSILVKFKIEQKDIFKIFTDFKIYDKNLIKEKILCIIKVYKNNARKNKR